MFAWVKEYLHLTVALRGKGRKVKDLQKTIPDKYDLVCHVKNNHHAESHDGAMVLMGEKTELHHERKTRRKHAPVGKVNRVRRSHCIVIDPNKTGPGAVDQCEKYSTQNGPCRKFWCPCRVANKRYWIAQLALSKAQKEYSELLGQRKALVHDALLRENFNARKEELSEARGRVEDLRQQYKALELPCKKPMSPVIVYDRDGGAHYAVSGRRPCFDYEKGKKCTKTTCAACEQNNQKVDLAIKLYAARGDRNRALVNLFFVTRKPAQLLKYMWLKYKAAKLYISYDESLDKVAGMKTDDSQFDAAVQDKRQKEKAYFSAVADMEAMRDKVFSLTR